MAGSAGSTRQLLCLWPAPGRARFVRPALSADRSDEGAAADADADRPRAGEVEGGAEHRVGVVSPAVAEGAGGHPRPAWAAQEDPAEGAGGRPLDVHADLGAV